MISIIREEFRYYYLIYYNNSELGKTTNVLGLISFQGSFDFEMGLWIWTQFSLSFCMLCVMSSELLTKDVLEHTWTSNLSDRMLWLESCASLSSRQFLCFVLMFDPTHKRCCNQHCLRYYQFMMQTTAYSSDSDSW